MVRPPAGVPPHSCVCDASRPSCLLQTLPSPARLPRLCLHRSLPSRPSFRGVCGAAHLGCSPSQFSGVSLLCPPLAGPPPEALPPSPPSGGDVGPHVSPARALCSLDLITPLMHLEASVARTAYWACYVPAPQADRIPDSRAHTCPPQTEHLTLFRGDLPSRSSEAAQQEWPELSATCPTAPRPACASQVYRRVRSKAVSHVQIVNPWFFAEHSFLVTSAWWHIGSSLIQPSGPHVMTLKWTRRAERCCGSSSWSFPERACWGLPCMRVVMMVPLAAPPDHGR